MATSRAKRQRREPVVTVHVIERRRGEDPVFDARWDAFWAEALAPLPDEVETLSGERERDGGEEGSGHQRSQHQHQQQTA